jgi:hypothetical protein
MPSRPFEIEQHEVIGSESATGVDRGGAVIPATRRDVRACKATEREHIRGVGCDPLLRAFDDVVRLAERQVGADELVVRELEERIQIERTLVSTSRLAEVIRCTHLADEATLEGASDPPRPRAQPQVRGPLRRSSRRPSRLPTFGSRLRIHDDAKRSARTLSHLARRYSHALGSNLAPDKVTITIDGERLEPATPAGARA